MKLWLTPIALIASAGISPAWSRDDSPQRLTLDLSHLRDRAPWELHPVVAHPVREGKARFHIVGVGESGIAIARAYRVQWRDVIAVNGLTDPYTLHAGQRLLLPDKAFAVAAGEPAKVRGPLKLDIDDIVIGGEPASTVVRVERPIMRASLRFTWPVAGRVVAPFGPQGSGRINQGIDIVTTPGGGIRAAGSGSIAYVGNDVPGYGGLILIRHDGGWISAYGRVASASVAKGVMVREGQTIGRAGQDEPMHFELRRARVPVDPERYLPKR